MNPLFTHVMCLGLKSFEEKVLIGALRKYRRISGFSSNQRKISG